MKYREFVEHAKHNIEQVVEHVAFDITKHFVMFDGDDGDGTTLVIQNYALNIPQVREATWKHRLLPLIEERKFKRLALIVAGPMWDPDEHEANGLGVQVMVADAERTEKWIAPVEFKAGELGLGEWEGTVDSEAIPDFHLLEEALR